MGGVWAIVTKKEEPLAVEVYNRGGGESGEASQRKWPVNEPRKGRGGEAVRLLSSL